MRHRKGNRKLGRPTDQRLAMLRELVASLLTYGKIQTTEARAREARRFMERLVTIARQDHVAARRHARKLLAVSSPVNADLVWMLFEIAPAVSSRSGPGGGYTRITRIGPRRGDGAMLVQLELVEELLTELERLQKDRKK
jgi:large subunit ribosomal protein L17